MKNKHVYNGSGAQGLRGELYSLFKILISGIFAFTILTFLCSFYSNNPQHHKDKDGATDYQNSPHTFYFNATEGFAFGRTNNEGYANTFDYINGMPVDILMMGASHLEAFNVFPEQSTSARLNIMTNFNVYNIGVSGHFLPVCACNIQAAVKKYMPSKYVIIETGTVNFSDKELEDIINDKIPEVPAYDGGFLGFLRHNSYLRLLYHQFKFYFQNKENVENNKTSVINYNNSDLLTKLLIKMRNAANSSGAKLIIAYHPGIAINDDGNMKIVQDEKIIAQFKELCEKNNIYFVNTGERFMREYKKDFTLPYGFWNTSAGKGHMNADGHRMFAEEIFNVIQKIENIK